MRLDLYLKRSRLVVRRARTGELCREGRVAVNDAPAKAARTIREGDRIRLSFPSREVTVEVVALPQRRSVSRAEARELYRVVDEKRFDLWGDEIA